MNDYQSRRHEEILRWDFSAVREHGRKQINKESQQKLTDFVSCPSFSWGKGKLGHYSKHTHSVSHLLELHYLHKIFQFLWIFFP